MMQIIVELYDALKAAGAPEDKAQAAAASVLPATANRFDKIDSDLAALKADLSGVKIDLAGVKIDLAATKAELALVKWLVGGIGFGVFLLVIKSFWPQ
jgi:hypothetical protein